MTTVNPSVASLGILRDLHYKVALDEALRRELASFAGSAPAQMEPSDAARWLRGAVDLTERVVTWLDEEATRVNEQRFALGDPMAVRNRLVGDARRQVDAAATALRQKVSAERAEWSRRVNKQVLDLQENLEQQLATMQVETAVVGGDGYARVHVGWQQAFEAWKTQVFSLWSVHLSALLPVRYDAAAKAELGQLGQLLGASVLVRWPAAGAATMPPRDPWRELNDRFDAPTAAGAMLESFKGGLSVVAMLAGMIIIPIVQLLLHEAASSLRAVVMGLMLAPMVGFAVHQGKRARERLLESQRQKALEKFKKALRDEFRALLDRFRTEVERVVNAYAQEAAAAVSAAVDPAVSAWAERREREVAQDLARSQMQSERLTDAASALRAARGGLTGTLLVDLKKRLSEVEAARS